MNLLETIVEVTVKPYEYKWKSIDSEDAQGEFTTENKYQIALIKDQKVLKLQDQLAENQVTEVLCIKGADTAPKSFMRFHQMDSIER